MDDRDRVGGGGGPVPAADHPTAVLRLAERRDVEAIDALMKASIHAIFPAFYDERQTESSAAYIGKVDTMLVDDGTYFVLEAGGEVVACGGWSRRDKLFSGSAVVMFFVAYRLNAPLSTPSRNARFAGQIRSRWARAIESNGQFARQMVPSSAGRGAYPSSTRTSMTRPGSDAADREDREVRSPAADRPIASPRARATSSSDARPPESASASAMSSAANR